MGLGSAQRAMPGSTKSTLIHLDSQAMEQSQYRGLAPRALQETQRDCIGFSNGQFSTDTTNTQILKKEFIKLYISLCKLFCYAEFGCFKAIKRSS